MVTLGTMKYQLLELIGICGELPATQIRRLTISPSYSEKIITSLKAEKLIRTHYKDGLKGYRLTKNAKELLLSNNTKRFELFLSGNSETNQVRSEYSRRLRLHAKAETLISLLNANIPFYPDEKPLLFSEIRETFFIGRFLFPMFYASREIKELDYQTTKIRNSRSMGVILAKQCVYALYNTGTGVLRWEYKTEIRLNAFLQYYLQGYPYKSCPQIRAIITGVDMELAYRLLTSTGGYKKSLFMIDNSYEHFHYITNDRLGVILLHLLVSPTIIENLNQVLLSDQDAPRKEIPFEHDAIDTNGRPTLLAYDFDMQRIIRFNTGINMYGLSGNLICFDFQIQCLRKYLSTDIRIASIDFQKFKRRFLNES